MRPIIEIEESIRGMTPILLATTEAVDEAAFEQRFDALEASAATATQPMLGSDAIRDQNILLVASSTLLAIG